MADAQKYIRRADKLMDRGNWDTHWSEIAELVLTRANQFIVMRTPGEKLEQKVFDSTPIHANELLASGLHSMLTNMATEWFSLSLANPELMKSMSVLEWLEEVQRIMYYEIGRPDAAFSAHMHEDYLEYGAFGTSIMFIAEAPDRDGVRFQARPLHECFVDENAQGVVDTVYRKFSFTVRQAVQQWGLEALHEDVQKMHRDGKLDEKIAIIHAVQPRATFDPNKTDRRNMPVESVYIDKKHKHVISEGGFEEMPFQVSRFYKASGEVYGRSPAMTTLPDIKMLNKAMQTIIAAAEKRVDPPLQVPDDTFINPTRTTPGGLNFYKPGTKDRIEPFANQGDVGLGMDLVDRIRMQIREAFFVDQLQLHEGPQMTATEVMQRTEEKLRLMGPLLGRVQVEKLGPMIERVFAILFRQGKFPEPPPEIEGAELKIEYSSPIARAQKQLEASGIVRTIEVMGPFAQIKPDLMDRFDTDQMLTDVGIDLFALRPTWFKTDEEVEGEREQRKAMEAANAATQIAEQGGRAAASIAQAQATAEQ